MRIGCAAHSYRELLKSGDLSLEEFVDLCADLRLDGVELTAYYFPSQERAYLNHLKRHCFRRGMHILGTAINTTFTLPDERKRRAQVDLARQWIERSEALGSPCLRVFAGTVPDGVPEDAAFRWARECLEELSRYGADRGVTVALENHGGLTSTAERIRRLLDAIRNPWLGVNLDLGNFPDDPYPEYEALAGATLSVHAKETYPSGEAQAEIDYERVREILAAAGYRGYLSIEYNGAEDPRIAVPRFAARLQAIFG